MISVELVDQVLIAAVSTMLALAAGGAVRAALTPKDRDEGLPVRTPPKVGPAYYRSTSDTDVPARKSSEPLPGENRLKAWIETKQSRSSALYRDNEDNGHTKGLLGELIAAQYFAAQGWLEHTASASRREGVDLLLVREKKGQIGVKAVEVKTTHSSGPVSCGIQLSKPQLKKRIEESNALASDSLDHFPVEILDQPGVLSKCCFIVDMNTRQALDAVSQTVLINDITPYVLALKSVLQHAALDKIAAIDGFDAVQDLSESNSNS